MNVLMSSHGCMIWYTHPCMRTSLEKRYREIIENLNDAVYTVDSRTLLFSSVNTAAEKLTGYTKKELLSLHIAKVIAPESLPLVKKMISAKKKKDQSTIYEVELVKKDGTRVAIEVSSRAIYEQGEITEIIGVARDITERKMVERSRNTFISLVTHEIKNPLTSVKLRLALLKKHVQKDEKATSHVLTISQQLRSIEQLMADFLDVLQMRVGKFRIERKPFDLNEAIDTVISDYDSKTHPITRQGTAAKKVKGDSRRICQVLVNLVSNARKYSQDGKEIFIRVESSSREVVVAVQDFGEGINKTDQKRIFEAYTRILASGKKSVKGHGLGLFICQQIIHLHKGRIWVESEKGKGSTFFFSLPIS